MKTIFSTGFSLTEVLIAAGMLSGFILISVNLFSRQVNEVSKTHIHENVSQTFFAIDQALAIHEGCEETFVKPGNIRPEGSGTEIENIYFRTGSRAFQKDAPIGQAGAAHAISVSTMTIRDFVYSSTNHGSAEFLVKLKTKQNKKHEQKYQVQLVVKNGVVTGCINKNEPVRDCRGQWSNCSVECDGGTQSYFIIVAEKNGGESCPHLNTESRSCNTQSCYGWISSDWGLCTGGTGGWSYGTWGECVGGVAKYSSGCTGCTHAFEGACAECGGGPVCWEDCSWLGTKTRTATCNASSNSGTQSRAVNCQNKGAPAPDNKCTDAKPSSVQNCTPTSVTVCGVRQAITADCPSTIKPNICPAPKQYCF